MTDGPFRDFQSFGVSAAGSAPRGNLTGWNDAWRCCPFSTSNLFNNPPAPSSCGGPRHRRAGTTLARQIRAWFKNRPPAYLPEAGRPAVTSPTYPDLKLEDHRKHQSHIRGPQGRGELSRGRQPTVFGAPNPKDICLQRQGRKVTPRDSSLLRPFRALTCLPTGRLGRDFRSRIFHSQGANSLPGDTVR